MRTSTTRTKSGPLRHSVELQEHIEMEQRGDGSIVPRWRTKLTVFASVSPLSGRQLERAQQIAGKVTHEIVMRYIPGVTRQLRLKFNDRFFTVAAVLNTNEQNVELRLLCNEAV